MEIIYRANDGKEFDCESDCLDHEMDLLIEATAGHIHGWNDSGKPLEPTDCGFCEKCYIVSLDNPQAVETFIKMCDGDRMSSDGIEEPGIYVWGDSDYAIFNDRYSWNNIEDIISEFDNRLCELTQIVNKCKEEGEG